MNIEEAKKQCAELINSDIIETIHCAKCEHDFVNECVEEGCLYNIAIETVLKELDRKDVLNKASAEVIENSILKEKIKEKIKELDKQYKEYATKWENSGMDKKHPFYKYLIRIEAEIDILQELLKESNEDAN